MDNGFFEPGETIEILPLVKNYWGPTDDVRVGIEFAEFEDTQKQLLFKMKFKLVLFLLTATLQDCTELLKLQLLMSC